MRCMSIQYCDFVRFLQASSNMIIVRCGGIGIEMIKNVGMEDCTWITLLVWMILHVLWICLIFWFLMCLFVDKRKRPMVSHRSFSLLFVVAFYSAFLAFLAAGFLAGAFLGFSSAAGTTPLIFSNSAFKASISSPWFLMVVSSALSSSLSISTG